MVTAYSIGGCYTFRVTPLMLSTLSLAGLNAYYLILSSTEHQKAYVLLKYAPLENDALWVICKHFAL